LHHSKSAILITYFFCMDQGKNHVSYASIDRLIELLSERHTVNIGRRWTFQCIRDLLDEGLITREPRYRQGTGGVISQLPSMVSFAKKGIDWLLANGVSKARILLENMINYFKRKDGRFPKEKDFTSNLVYPSDPIEAKRLKHLAAISTKDIT